ncbi:hypothetical protein [Streptomyces sp. 8N706]|uniref:hypothetical protein n=1 Tax=Streptomyces sp. 8N706 TaxID=3457416 RepID=UPI003FD617C9
MSATTPTDPQRHETGWDRAVWPLLIFVLVLVMLIIAGGLLYVAVRHPALATPLQVATGGVGLLATLVTLMVTLPRR